MANEMQRLSLAVEKMADQIRDDLRDIDRALDYHHDRLRDIVEHLERIENRLRRQDQERANGINGSGPIPVPIRDSASQPIALRAPSEDTQPTPKVDPYDDGHSGITADREKLVLRWDFLASMWRWGRWGLLPALGAGVHHALEWLHHLK